ncbi:MAG TPA: FMN-binding protein [Chloroflexota bacterium]|nr:FMN-binding protein [Chloroflexota bacterium]
MTHSPVRRRALPLTVAAMAAGGILTSASAHAASAKSVTYKGPAVEDRWGTAKVSIVVKNKKITNVKASVSYENARSEFIDSNAVPLLKQEVLQAQSANIEYVSGATITSQAFTSSLQSAIKKAIKAKALTAKALK